MRKIMNQLLALQNLEVNGRAQTAASQTETKQLREQVPAPILAHYDRLMASGRQGVAIACNAICGECHLPITSGQLLALFAGKDLQLCDNCGRYLCLPPEASDANHAA
jgi:predicted  nucleic acid-binding Zn-ribbon protein